MRKVVPRSVDLAEKLADYVVEHAAEYRYNPASRCIKITSRALRKIAVYSLKASRDLHWCRILADAFIMAMRKRGYVLVRRDSSRTRSRVSTSYIFCPEGESLELHVRDTSS